MGTTRRRRETEIARSLITESAARVFAQRGYHGATMDAIAREAGYSPAAIYKYFRNKRAIFEDVLETLTSEFLEVFDKPAPATLSFEHRLRWMLQQLVSVLTKHQDFYIAFQMESGTFAHELASELGDEHVDRHRKSHLAFMSRIAAFMEEGRGRDELSSDLAAGDYAAAFMGICNGLFFRWLTMGQQYSLDRDIDLIVSLFLYGACSRAKASDDDAA